MPTPSSSPSLALLPLSKHTVAACIMSNSATLFHIKMERTIARNRTNTQLFYFILFLLADAPSSYPDNKEGEALRLLEAVKSVKPTAIIGVR